MPRPVVCPQCREELDIPAEFRGRPVRCSACNGVFTPPADAGDDVPVAAVRRPADRDTGRDYDDRDDPVDRGDGREVSRRPGSRRPPPPVRKSSFLWLWLLLAGTCGVCCLGCAGIVRFSMRVADPTLIPYTSADGQFRAAFPGAPAVGTKAADNNRTTTTVEWKRMLMGQAVETYFVHSTDLKRTPPRNAADRLAREAADAVVNRPGYRETKRLPVIFAGATGWEVHALGEDDEMTLARVFVAGDRLYVVGVSGHGLEPPNTQRVYKFWDEFQLTAAPKAGKAAPKADADDKPEEEKE